MTKRQVCSNSGSSILEYVTSNSFSTPSIVPVTITNTMPVSTFKKGKRGHSRVQRVVQSNSVSHSASTVVPDPVAISSKHTSHSTQAFQSEMS